MRAFAIVLVVMLIPAVAGAQGQDLGHRLPGGVGLDAGTQQGEGIYVADRVVGYTADRVNDRHGDAIPIVGLEIRALANVFGISGTVKLEGGPYLSAAVGVPVVKLSARAVEPEASVDRLGLGSVFLQPLKIGQRFSQFDLVASYSVYVPTGEAERPGLGKPEWVHQLSGGGTVFFDDQRGWRVSALGSYVIHHEKQGIDITRGDTLMFQGGLGGPVFEFLDVGIAGYALWQVTDDTGPDLPDALRGARERVFGLGPEVSLTVEALHMRVTARFEWDLGAEARPEGQLVLVGLTFPVWRPTSEPAAR